MFVPRLFKLSVAGLGRVADSMLTCSKLSFPARLGTLVYWTKMGRLKVLLEGVMVPPELTEMFELPEPLKMVAVAESVPPTAICESVFWKVNVSPVAKLRVPLSVSVWSKAIWTRTLGPTATVAPRAMLKPVGKA